MSFYKWSQTAASNASADSTINWAEGQSPSTVNDSARAMMAAAAKFRDDIAGTLTTAGTSTVYTLTTNQVFSSLATMDGKLITFVPHVTCGAAPTLNVDGLGAKSINTQTNVAAGAGDLVANSVYSAVYYNTPGEWRLIGGFAQLNAPVGTVMIFQQTAAPTGWTKSTTHNDKALRIVSGAVSSGGSVAFSTLFARTGTDAVTLAQANVPSYNLSLASLSVSITDPTHSHGVTDPTHTHTEASPNVAGPAGVTSGGSGIGGNTNTGASATGVTVNAAATGVTAALAGTLPSGGSGSAFTPAIDMRVNYVDIIAATKN